MNLNMDDIELRNIEPDQPLIRSLSRSESFTQQDDVIDTEYGAITVAVQGDRNKPAILTFHDIGLNHISNFQAFFNFVDMRILMQSFTVYHVNAPGQSEGAPNLPENYIYPTMDELAETLVQVMKFYGLKHFIGFGVGAGANILSRFALEHPDCVDGMFLVNPTCTVASWTEWGYQKLNAMHLRSSGMTASTLDYLMWHHFGRLLEERSHDLIQIYRQYFNTAINPYNLSLFIDSYIRRTDLGIIREMDPVKKKTAKNFKCHVLLLAGDMSPHLEDSVTMNSRLDPTNSTWMKLSNCGMVLEEEPAKVSEALRYFLQGLGYALNQYRRKSSAASSLSCEGSSSNTSNSAHSRGSSAAKLEVHIVENPINRLDVPC
ncbi:protein NDRG3-like isoform X1 [Argiope bruennichi]|uniref:protein NDRG3-like isoform X1 n=1 Tax=Argiope bruennichi TaxID=94029 RepID=UPI0024940E08|nr:protein NDRG3-like isoform X1 [Argiope bruennichi]XP_055931635.1 protein NDRG3-like isoform X1 [Argiope bruennichi]XP_055931636.1 protein NDRG3-like isoform X1 [Argiope bruennichi]